MGCLWGQQAHLALLMMTGSCHQRTVHPWPERQRALCEEGTLRLREGKDLSVVTQHYSKLMDPQKVTTLLADPCRCLHKALAVRRAHAIIPFPGHLWATAGFPDIGGG